MKKVLHIIQEDRIVVENIKLVPCVLDRPFGKKCQALEREELSSNRENADHASP